MAPFSTNEFHLFLNSFMEDYTFSMPLLTTTTSAANGGATKEPSFPDLILRLVLVILIGTISIWANHEASKGFKITIINNAAINDSPAWRRFHLFYVSNDEATRIILNTSALVENILYPPHHHSKSDQTKKQVHHVVLQLAAAAADNVPTTTKVSVSVSTSKSKESVYIISLSPSIMEESDFKYSVTSAIQRAMARIWLYDGQSMAPTWLIDGMEEYMWMQAGFGESTLRSGSKFGPEPGQLCYVLSQVCSESKMNISDVCGDNWNLAKYSGGTSKEPKIVAQALGYLEQENKGYIQGLNQILKDGWNSNLG